MALVATRSVDVPRPAPPPAGGRLDLPARHARRHALDVHRALVAIGEPYSYRVVAPDGTAVPPDQVTEQDEADMRGDLKRLRAIEPTAPAAAVARLRQELLDLLEDPSPSPERAKKARALVEVVDIDELRRGDEGSRWIAYLATLGERKVRGQVTPAQELRFLEIWRSARRMFPGLRRPAVTHTDDGRMHVGWSFTDLPGVTFTVDIERDGRVDWFYRNTADHRVCGTEDEPEPELPEEALRYLAPFAR